MAYDANKHVYVRMYISFRTTGCRWPSTKKSPTESWRPV